MALTAQSNQATPENSGTPGGVQKDCKAGGDHTLPSPSYVTTKIKTEPGRISKAEEGRPTLPPSLESIQKSDYFPTQRHRWNTNEEIAAILISFDKHEDWLSKEVKIRPKSGSMLLYSRKRVRYRRDGYCWKKRKDGKTTREDHMKLKVQGTECIYGCYVHSAILPTFHRRCYWLLQNPDVVLVHYLNVPYSDDNKLLVTPSLSYCSDKKEWTKEELVSQLKPMFFSESEPNLNNELEISTAETVEAIVQQLMEKQHSKVSVRTHECPCDSTTKPTPTPAENKRCSHTLHRIISPKTQQAAVVGAPTSTADHPAKVIAQTTALVPVSRPTEHKYASAAQTASSTPEVSSAPTAPRASNVILAAPCRQILHDSRQVEASTVPVARSTAAASTTASLILSLSQLQGGGGLLILNSTTSAAGVELTPASMTPVTLLYGREPVTTSTAVTSQNSSDASKSNTVISSTSISSALHMDNSIQEDKAHYEDQLENVHIGDDSLCDIVETKEAELSSTTVDPSSEAKDNSNLFDETINMSEDNMSDTFHVNQSQSKPVFSNVTNLTSQISIKAEPLHSDSDPVDLNPMDFIDNDISTPDEEIFNLDTFDMLTDLPNLDDLNTDLSPRRSPSCSTLSSRTSTVMSKLNPENSRAHHALDYREGTANITDYSPDWSYTEGGVKVLVAGPWYSTTSPYTIIFDGVSVPTALVQTGVLRCYCPAHEAGLVTLQVACEGFVISNSVIFEYRECPAVSQQKTDDWFGIDDGTLKFCLLERLEMLETRVNLCQQDSITRMSFKVPQQVSNKQYPFEDRLVIMCHKLINASWLPGEDAASAFQNCTRSNLSILHLASALGYSRLVCTLLHWRAENPSLILDSQVDAFSQDKNECTPLIWACARGHKEVALLLYQWNSAAMNLRDRIGRSPIDISRERGYVDIANEIEQLEKARLSQSSSNSSSSSSLLTSSSTGTVVNSYLPDTTDNLKHSQKVRIKERPYKKCTCNEKNSLLGLNSLGIDVPLALTEDKNKINLSNYRNIMDVGENHECCNPECNEMVGMSAEEEEIVSVNTVGSSGCSRRESYGSCDLAISSSSGPEADSRVLTLAEHIIAAMPDRIKASTSSGVNSHDDTSSLQIDSQSCLNASISNILHSPIFTDETDVMEVVSVDGPPPTLLAEDRNSEFNDQAYRYCDVSTPTSSLSPASSSCLQSPRSLNLESPSPPPSMADFCEYFQASGKVMEKDFSNLTLSDVEQRQLYEAAKIIQKAYRSYKGRKRQEESLEKERVAAILIQSYYRRYKQYMYYKQMTKAAQVIQNQYRSYCEHKRFKKNLESDGEVASTSSSISASSSNGVPAGPSRRVDSTTVQSYYHHSFPTESEKRSDLSREGTPTSSALKRTFSQRRQHQAARKIQQFMRQSKNKLQKERASAAEKEKSGVETLAHLNQPLVFQEHLSNINALQNQ